MTYIESPLKTIEKFIPSWRNTPINRLDQEIISAFNETHRHPDEYKYKFEDGELRDFSTATKINIDTSTYFGQKDAELLSVLTSWVSENPTGVAVWISPESSESYPCNKITMYKIEETMGLRSTTNISVLFDTPGSHTLEIAKKLNPSFSDVKNPEILRNKLFVVDDDFGMADLLKLIDSHVDPAPPPDYNLVHYFSELIQKGVSARFIADKMQEKGVLGSFSISCGAGKSMSGLTENTLTINLSGPEDKYGSLHFTCPKCGATNTRPFGQLISNCQHCGGDVRC